FNPEINHIIKKTLINILPKLVGLKGSIHDVGYWQVLGFDIMFNDKGKAFLLEVNATPAVPDNILQQFSEKVASILINNIDNSISTSLNLSNDTLFTKMDLKFI